jgi:hypothetical protein
VAVTALQTPVLQSLVTTWPSLLQVLSTLAVQVGADFGSHSLQPSAGLQLNVHVASVFQVLVVTSQV